MKIYVACLAAYNNGHHHGKWIDLYLMDIDDLHKEIQGILKESPIPNAEEWAIHDFEADISIKEYHDLEELIELQAIMDKHDEAIGCLIYKVKQDLGGNTSLEDALTYYEENYIGEFSNHEELGEHFFDQGLIEIPKDLVSYFDFERYGRDCSYDLMTIDNHYFWNR